MELFLSKLRQPIADPLAEGDKIQVEYLKEIEVIQQVIWGNARRNSGGNVRGRRYSKERCQNKWINDILRGYGRSGLNRMRISAAGGEETLSKT